MKSNSPFAPINSSPLDSLKCHRMTVGVDLPTWMIIREQVLDKGISLSDFLRGAVHASLDASLARAIEDKDGVKKSRIMRKILIAEMAKE